MSENRGDILLVGTAQDADLQYAIAATFEIAARTSFRVRQATDIPAAIDRLRAGADSPWLIVVAQSWPGQFAMADIDRLRRAAPLATICGLLGSWCEGETRSGRPWPSTFRVAWNDWPARLERECCRAAQGIAGDWSLPPTSATEELLLKDALQAGRDAATAGADAVIAILAETRAAQTAWADAARARGYRPIVAALGDGLTAPVPTSGPVAAIVLWDATVRAISDAGSVSRATRLAPRAPIIAVVGFPRAEDVSRARVAGIAAVFAKPARLSDVFWRIAEARRYGEEAAAAR